MAVTLSGTPAERAAALARLKALPQVTFAGWWMLTQEYSYSQWQDMPWESSPTLIILIIGTPVFPKIRPRA